MEPHVKWYIAAVIWAIVAAIGFALLFLAPDGSRLLSLSEMLGIIGAIGSWLSATMGATARGQAQMLGLQREMLRLQHEMPELQHEMLKGKMRC